MTEILEKVTGGKAYAGQKCIVCQNPIGPEDEVVVCPRCRQIHHADCWKNNGGCGKIGCPQTAKAITSTQPRGDGPPPPISKKAILAGVFLAIVLTLTAIFWPKPPDPASGRAKIVVMGEADYKLDQIMTDLADQFNAANEEVYIDLQLLPHNLLEQKLFVVIAAGEAPDLILARQENLSALAEQGVLLPLGEDAEGAALYSIEHPAQPTRLAVWKNTEYPDQALQVLDYFLDHISRPEQQPF